MVYILYTSADSALASAHLSMYVVATVGGRGDALPLVKNIEDVRQKS